MWLWYKYVAYVNPKVRKYFQMLLAGNEVNSTLRKHAHVIYRKFHGFKKDDFQKKNCDIFLIFAQNIDCRYTLEPPH